MCKRELGGYSTAHHLVPKERGGKETIDLHKICHNKIHSTFTNYELEKYYHTIERLLENDDIRNFMKWLQNKPIDFYIGSKDTNDRKKKRRR
jgi:hypothetical protein